MALACLDAAPFDVVAAAWPRWRKPAAPSGAGRRRGSQDRAECIAAGEPKPAMPAARQRAPSRLRGPASSRLRHRSSGWRHHLRRQRQEAPRLQSVCPRRRLVSPCRLDGRPELQQRFSNLLRGTRLPLVDPASDTRRRRKLAIAQQCRCFRRVRKAYRPRTCAKAGSASCVQT